MDNFEFKKEFKKLEIQSKITFIFGSISFINLFIFIIVIIVKKFMSNPIYEDDNLDVIPSNYEINETFLLIVRILFALILITTWLLDMCIGGFIIIICKEFDCKKLLFCGCFGILIPLIPFYFATKILKTINDELNSQSVKDLQKNNMQFNSKYNNLNGNYNYFSNNNIYNNPQNNSQNLYKSVDTNMNNNFNNSDDDLCTKIKKIYELKEKGIITEEEFQDLKKF